MADMKGTRELLGAGRTIPASHTMAHHVDRALLDTGTSAQVLDLALSTRARATKQPEPERWAAHLVGEKLEDVAHELHELHHEDDALAPMKGVYRVVGGAQEMLADVRQALMHDHPVAVGLLVGKDFLAADGKKTLEPTDQPEEERSYLVVGYDDQGRFELVGPKGWGNGGSAWASGECLMRATYACVPVAAMPAPKQ
jgi:hypothetical protein